MDSLLFQFSTCDSLIDEAIRLRTDSDISHVDVVTFKGNLLGAQLGKLPSLNYSEQPPNSNLAGVQIRPPTYEVFTRKLFVKLQVTSKEYVSFWAFVCDQLGKPYDVTAICGLASHRNWHEPEHWFCSELQAAALESAGIITVGTEVNWVDPQTLLLLLQEKANDRTS